VLGGIGGKGGLKKGIVAVIELQATAESHEAHFGAWMGGIDFIEQA